MLSPIFLIHITQLVYLLFLSLFYTVMREKNSITQQLENKSPKTMINGDCPTSALVSGEIQEVVGRAVNLTGVT